MMAAGLNPLVATPVTTGLLFMDVVVGMISADTGVTSANIGLTSANTGADSSSVLVCDSYDKV